MPSHALFWDYGKVDLTHAHEIFAFGQKSVLSIFLPVAMGNERPPIDFLSALLCLQIRLKIGEVGIDSLQERQLNA